MNVNGKIMTLKTNQNSNDLEKIKL
jgi:hypothetical protein